MRLCETALLKNLIKSSASCLVSFRQRERLYGDDSKLGVSRVTEHKIRSSFSAQFTWQRTLRGSVWHVSLRRCASRSTSLRSKRDGDCRVPLSDRHRVRARESRAYVESSAGSRDAAFPRVPGCPLR